MMRTCVRFESIWVPFLPLECLPLSPDTPHRCELPLLYYCRDACVGYQARGGPNCPHWRPFCGTGSPIPGMCTGFFLVLPMYSEHHFRRWASDARVGDHPCAPATEVRAPQGGFQESQREPTMPLCLRPQGLEGVPKPCDHPRARGRAPQ